MMSPSRGASPSSRAIASAFSSEVIARWASPSLRAITPKSASAVASDALSPCCRAVARMASASAVGQSALGRGCSGLASNPAGDSETPATKNRCVPSFCMSFAPGQCAWSWSSSSPCPFSSGQTRIKSLCRSPHCSTVRPFGSWNVRLPCDPRTRSQSPLKTPPGIRGLGSRSQRLHTAPVLFLSPHAGRLRLVASAELSSLDRQEARKRPGCHQSLAPRGSLGRDRGLANPGVSYASPCHFGCMIPTALR